VFVTTSDMARPAGAWPRVAFSVASLTDYVDGWVARSFDLVTSFGKWPTDARQGAHRYRLVLLVRVRRLSWWATPSSCSGVGVTALRFWVIRTA